MQQARCEGAQTTKNRLLLLLLLFFDLDHTYEEFYGKGKKNKIIHIPKNSFWSPGMKLTREGKTHLRCFCTNPVSFRGEIKEGVPLSACGYNHIK